MASLPRYLALDLGTHTGWALVEGDKIIGSGVMDFSAKKTQHIGTRFLKLQKFIADIDKLGNITEIFYEKIMFSGQGRGDYGELYHGLLAIVSMASAALTIPTFGVWPGTLKKDFTGSGVAEKVDMCSKAHQLGWRGGEHGTDNCHDEADAIALLVTQLKQRYNITVKF